MPRLKIDVQTGCGAEEIKVNYEQVASETQALSSCAEAEQQRVEITYALMMKRLGELDGGTNATLIDVGNLNREKTIAKALVLNKLSMFVADASRYTQNTEDGISTQFVSR